MMTREEAQKLGKAIVELFENATKHDVLRDYHALEAAVQDFVDEVAGPPEPSAVLEDFFGGFGGKAGE